MKTTALRNSDCLLEAYPMLKEHSQWKAFAKTYDQPESIECRNKAIRSFVPEKLATVKELEEHCRAILSIFYMVREKEGKPGQFHSSREVDLARTKAAEQLAKKIRIAFSPTKEGSRLRNAFRAEADRQKIPRERQDKASKPSIVCFAFLRFIDREKQLPTKKELNIEANRLSTCQEIEGKERLFGDALEFRRLRWIVYDGFSTDYDFNDDGEVIKETWKSRIVPSDEWNKVRWKRASGLAGYTTPLGLKGLPEAHGDKGKRG